MMNQQVAVKTTETRPGKQANAPASKQGNAGAFVGGPQSTLMALQDAAGNRAVGQVLGVMGPGVTGGRAATGGVLQRKCACGRHTNRGGECEECRQKRLLGLQTKLKVNVPGDVYEQEADRVAEQVMAAPANPTVTGAPAHIQRFSGHSNGQMGAAPASVDRALASPGRPLEPGLRQDMDQRFGHDFSGVRVHSDEAAKQSAQDVNAHAYTVGQDIVFGAERFAPGTHEGRRLLAHELVHVVQQAGDGSAVQRFVPCTPARMSLEDCPNREPDEDRKSRREPMIVEYITSPEVGYLIANFNIGESKLKANATRHPNWPKMIRTITQPGSQWEVMGLSDCHGTEATNKSLRQQRADAVRLALPAAAAPHIVATSGASLFDCITDNENRVAREWNRAALLRPMRRELNLTPTLVEGRCIPPREVSAPSGKKCRFFVYDSEEPTYVGKLWKVAAVADATPRAGAYVIPSGKSIDEMLEKILTTYAMKDCGCTDELQFWSHGSPGNGMYISLGGEFTTDSFKIPGLQEFGDGPTSMPGYREWHDKLAVQQRRLVLLRRTICSPDSTVYYRSCQAFQGETGQDFAKASASFWRSEVVGHTKLIGLTQPGKHTLRPCQKPDWSQAEGEEELGKKGKDEKLRHVKPR